jgi:hypothetical protein
MARRDGFVDFPLSIPVELHYLVESYKNDMKIVSFNAAIRSLLESHPAIAMCITRVYDRANGAGSADHGERVPSS